MTTNTDGRGIVRHTETGEYKMNATDDGTEPIGEAPELTHTDTAPKGLVHQSIPLKIGSTTTTVQVPAQPTDCPYLVIAPAIGSTADGKSPRFRGTLALTHTRTGAVLAESTYVRGLEKLAAALTTFHWDFDTRDHFAQPNNTDMANAVRQIIRDWQIDQGYSGPVSLYGDDDDKRAAREREPATTLLREQLHWWTDQYKSIHERELIRKNQEAWYEAISCSVNGWGMTYLLAVLQRVAPDVADIAARRLVAEFDAGDTMGEWVFQWSQEMDSGKPLTLHGIPDVDPLAQFGPARESAAVVHAGDLRSA